MSKDKIYRAATGISYRDKSGKEVSIAAGDLVLDAPPNALKALTDNIIEVASESETIDLATIFSNVISHYIVEVTPDGITGRQTIEQEEEAPVLAASEPESAVSEPSPVVAEVIEAPAFAGGDE